MVNPLSGIKFEHLSRQYNYFGKIRPMTLVIACIPIAVAFQGKTKVSSIAFGA
jgi:hypothetical protein